MHSTYKGRGLRAIIYHYFLTISSTSMEKHQPKEKGKNDGERNLLHIEFFIALSIIEQRDPQINISNHKLEVRSKEKGAKEKEGMDTKRRKKSKFYNFNPLRPLSTN